MIQVCFLFISCCLWCSVSVCVWSPVLMSPWRCGQHCSVCPLFRLWLHMFRLRWQLLISTRMQEPNEGTWPTHTHTHTHTDTLLSHPHNSFPLLLWHLSVTQQHGWCFETNTRSSLEWVRLSGELRAAEYTSVCCDRSQGGRECSLKLQGCWNWCFSGFGSELVKGKESKSLK